MNKMIKLDLLEKLLHTNWIMFLQNSVKKLKSYVPKIVKNSITKVVKQTKHVLSQMNLRLVKMNKKWLVLMTKNAKR